MNNNNLKNKILVTTGVILITMGLTLLLSDYVKEKRDLVFSDINLEILKLSFPMAIVYIRKI